MRLEDTALGIELGSTRIKAVLIDADHRPIASGSFEWENRLENGIWTYATEDIDAGIRACYADLARDFREKFGCELTTVGAIGVSGMMHGYFPLDGERRPLCPIRTWRNTRTGAAAAELSRRFGFNIPQRWSVSHLYRAVLDGEEHLSRIKYLTTMAGYIHLRLTGEHAVGIGEASGMFPIDSAALDYDARMADIFDSLMSGAGCPLRVRELFPAVKPAGVCAGHLTADGAAFLDPTGTLKCGIPMAPPEGDAGTGMTATNSVRAHTGNVSAGTSDFAMVVVERLPRPRREIDMVTTPAGLPVAMVHCNNCTSELNAWISMFSELISLAGGDASPERLYPLLFEKALEGAPDGGGLMAYNYVSGEGVTDMDSGRPLLMRAPDAPYTVANFMRTQLMSALATLKIGLDILTGDEGVVIDRLCAHGGLFKTPRVGQTLLSAATGVPAVVTETAGEGGPYGMALLAMYMLRGGGMTLEDYLDERVFADTPCTSVIADSTDIAGFESFIRDYTAALGIERAAAGLFQPE